MVMENREGPCPRINETIYFELQYETADDGSTEYKDCSCSELICCAEYDESLCPQIWIDFFNAAFGTNLTLQVPGDPGGAPDGAEQPPADEPPAEG